MKTHTLNIFYFLSFLISTFFVLVINDIYFLGEFYFWILLSFCSIDYLIKRKIELIHIWQISFSFIVLSEVSMVNFYSNNYSLIALKYLVLANNILFLGYLTKKQVISIPDKSYDKSKRNNYLIFNVLIWLSILLYLWNIASTLVNSLFLGRVGQDDSSNILGTIINAIGFILPSIICYKYVVLQKKNFLIPLIISLPIFAVQFIIGTRFPLLFSIIGFGIVLFSNHTIKSLSLLKKIYIMIGFFLLLQGSKIMKSFRAYGFNNLITNQISDKNDKIDGLAKNILSFGSNEGVVDMTALMIKHFNTNPHLYGESSSFLLYFWIPRSLWPNKPTMLGNWFIRKYRSGFSEGHSVSFGFTGDLYADFGYFSLFFIFILGRLLKKLEIYKNKAINSNNFNLILGAMLYPFIFFFVRSPITSIITFLSIILYYNIYKKILYLK